MRIFIIFSSLIVSLLPMAPFAIALPNADCRNAQSYSTWLSGFKKKAATAGISKRILNSALHNVTPSKTVLRLDRGQKAFRMSFEKFVKVRITRARVSTARRKLKKHKKLFNRIEKRFGVAREVLVAIWAMETDFGRNQGKMSVIRSLATLAHDCRRKNLFEGELIAALKIIQRGDMNMRSMRGAWAGELGQTQFLASNYIRFAIDFDGNGRRDLIHSSSDALASTANYLKGYGWQRNFGWNPGEANFNVIRQWNKSDIYSRAIALFATRLANG